MQSAVSAIQWRELTEPGDRLRGDRLQCHHAVQLNTRFARAFAKPSEDDSHTSLSWDFERNALIGVQAGLFRVGLRIGDLTLVLIGGAGEETSLFRLHGRTFAQAMEWLAGNLRHAGLDPAPLANPIHFELDEHPLLHGALFEETGHEKELRELAGWYGNAAACLADIGQPVRCWPHHFDIASQIIEGNRTIGAGLSPGDGSYDQPYFYVTPWPYPELSQLPRLETGGWHTKDWTGAVLTSDEILASPEQEVLVNGFLRNTIDPLRGA